MDYKVCENCKERNKCCNKKTDGITDSLFSIIIAIILLFTLLGGVPSIAESLRVIMQKWAACFGHC